MNLSIRRLRPPDLNACADIVLRGHSLPEKGTRQALTGLWNALMRAGSAVSGVVENEEPSGRRVVGFGMAVFVQDAFVREAQQRRLPPYILCRFLCRWTRREALPVLAAQEVERAQRAGGLNFLGLHTEFGENVHRPDECLLVRDALFRSLAESFRGYNLKYWLKEVYGPEERERFHLRFGCRVLSDYEEAFSAGLAPRPAEATRPFLLGLSDAAALRPENEPYAVREMFVKRWPRYGFTAGQRTLLHLAALEGVTRQEDQAGALAVSLPAVKKRWESVYTRIAARDAASPPEMELPESGQLVNHVLDYVRGHPQEVRPAVFPWP